MTDKMTCRTFPTAFKLAAIKRLMAGEAVLPLARELGVSRKILHDWRKAWDLHGPSGLNRKRGPKPGPRKFRPLAGPAAKDSSGELANARAKIAELERKIGQQAVDIVQRDGVRVDLIDAALALGGRPFCLPGSGEKIDSDPIHPHAPGIENRNNGSDSR